MRYFWKDRTYRSFAQLVKRVREVHPAAGRVTIVDELMTVPMTDGSAAAYYRHYQGDVAAAPIDAAEAVAHG